MYRKRTKTTHENTGNSKKRKLKYELYDSRFHKSYDTIKTEDYDDYSMIMDGGANDPTNAGDNASSGDNIRLDVPNTGVAVPESSVVVPNTGGVVSSDNANPIPVDVPNDPDPNKKVIFYDEKNEFDTFISKWFEPPNNYIDMSSLNKKFKSTFGNYSNSNKYDILLAKLFNKFNDHKVGEMQTIASINDNNIFTTTYITDILKQLNNEKDNTVAVFEYDLYLYNLDTILEKYKSDSHTKFTTFFGNNDDDEYFKKHIKNAKNLFGVNAIIEDVDSGSGKKIKMYIPKLLKTSKSLIDELKGGSNLNPQTTYEPYNITKLKKLENKNSKEITRANKKIRTKFVSYDELWDTVLNDKKLHYGFEGETPKNLIKNNNGSGKEFTLSNDNDKAIIERYFKKCNDLQQLYINKHIELLAIFKKMNEYINLNNTINDIIKKLVDPKYFNSKGVDGKLKLPKPVITDLQGLLKQQKLVKKVINENTTGEEKKGEVKGGEEGGEEEGEEEREVEAKEEEGKKNAPKDKYIVDNLEEYEFLQLIKLIQLSNEKSIKNILGKDKRFNLNDLILEYEQNIISKKYQPKNSNTPDPKWKSFNIENTNTNTNLYFNNSDTLGTTSTNSVQIQKVIYKCYDLQIVYLVKHIEVIEMFKLVYYYYDMMIKKIGILFFILSLYHKSNIDFTNVIIRLPLGTANVGDMIQNRLQSGVQTGGASTKEDIIANLTTEINDYNNELTSYKYNKTDYKTKAIEEIKPLLESNPMPILKLFNTLLTYFKAFSDNKDNFKNYDYIDKLLIQLLKTILPDIAETKGTYTNDEAIKIFKVIKNIYFDIKDQEIKIHQKQDNVKKEKSSYGVVKIGQFSKMDYDISQTIANNFKKIFEYRIKDEIDYSKDSYKHYTQYESLDKITEFILNARSLLRDPKEKENAKIVIGKIENSMVDLFNSVEGEATITTNDSNIYNDYYGGGNLIGGANDKLKYISNAIEMNKTFGDDDIPTDNEDSEHIKTSLFEEYRLNFLDLLKNIYFPTNGNVNLKNMTIVKEIELLEQVLQKVRYKGQPETITNTDTDKINVIYIIKSAFEVLNFKKLELEKKMKDDEYEEVEDIKRQRQVDEEARRKTEELERKIHLEAERKAEEVERQSQEEAEEAERKRRAEVVPEPAGVVPESVVEQAPVVPEPVVEEVAPVVVPVVVPETTAVAPVVEPEEAEEAEEAERKRREAEEKAVQESILKKIKYILEVYERKKENTIIVAELEALSITGDNVQEGLNGHTLLTNLDWWPRRQVEADIKSEDIQIVNNYYSQLLSILQGSALIYVNLSPQTLAELPEVQGGGAIQNMFNVNYGDKTLTFNSGDSLGLCKDKKSTHGPYELIFPEQSNKNEAMYQALFDEISNDTTTVEFKVDDTPQLLQKQELMKPLKAGKSVVLFGFGFSGSGKTYTLIEGGKGENENDKSILYQFIEKNKPEIGSIDFIEIYPYPDKPTFFVGTTQNQKNTLSTIINPSDSKVIIPTTQYNTIEMTVDTTIDSIKARIKQIEDYRRSQLRILPTPNNSNSSRSFLQITIKLNKDNDVKKGGQLVIFDMPGTESTVRIKEMMLGTESYVKTEMFNELINYEAFNKYETSKDKFIFNEIAKNYFFEFADKADIKIQTHPGKSQQGKSQLAKIEQNFDISLCKSLYKAQVNIKFDSCEISNLFEGFDTYIKQNHLKTNPIYNFVTIKYKKQYDNSYTIFSVKAKNHNGNNLTLTKNIMNVLFKYFILNIYKFQNLDIILPLDKDKIEESNKYIASIGFELASFFNKKAYLTHDDYFNAIKNNNYDEIIFLKNEDYLNIYNKFLSVILIEDNFDSSGIDLSSNLTIKEQTQMKEVFEFKVQSDTEQSDKIQFTLNDEVYTQSLEIKNLDPFFDKTKPKTNTKSIFIKYIVFILSYINQKSKTLKTKILTGITKEKTNLNVVDTDKNDIKTLEQLEQLYKEYSVLMKNVDLNTFDDNKKQFVTANSSNKSSSLMRVKRINTLYTQLFPNTKPDSTTEHKIVAIKTQLANITKAKLNYITAKAYYDIENMRLRASVYFIYKYIRFIVNQGSGVMTTLEHLKFFFLSRAGKIEAYNQSVDETKKFIIDGKIDIFNERETYKNTKGEIEEEINIGEMKKYGLISILQSLAGDETNLDTIKTNKLAGTPIPNLLTPKQAQPDQAQPDQSQPEQVQPITKSKFIMLAHINPFPKQKDEEADKVKKCNSASDTLEYIDSISANNIQKREQSAGYYRKKKYYKNINSSLSPTLKQHRIKRFITLKKNKNYKQNLFTSKTKKQL